MICLNVPLCIIGAFLILTLVVGIYVNRTQTSFQEYAVGTKQFSTATLVATVLATIFGGGGFIRNVQCVHEIGLWWIMLLLLNPFRFWLMSRLTLRMGPFMHHLSVAETIGSVYGTYPRIIAAVCSICNGVIIIAMQIIAIFNTFKMCLGSIETSLIITFFCTLLFIFYSMFGGVRAVTYTDVLQFITFSMIIPLLGSYIFIKVGKPISEIVPILQSHTKFQFSNLFCFKNQLMLPMVLLTLFVMVPFDSPATMQRIYMASSPIQAQKTFAYTTIFSFIITFFMILVGVFVFAGAPDLPQTAIWDYIMAHIPSPFQGFLATSLLAMAMSTADSSLNICSVMMSHDIVKSIKEISDKRQLKIARWTTLIVGLLAMMIAYQCQDLLKLMYWLFDCIGPIIVPPFILAFLGFWGTSRTAYIGMATGLSTILAWNKWVEPETGLNGSFIAILANGLAMMAAHYLLKQPKSAGWIRPQQDTDMLH